jgi:SlyX protein
MNLEERVMELESRLAFQDDTIQALNDVLVVQRRELDHLQQQMAAMLERQQEIGSQFEAFQEDVPPPHY